MAGEFFCTSMEAKTTSLNQCGYFHSQLGSEPGLGARYVNRTRICIIHTAKSAMQINPLCIVIDTTQRILLRFVNYKYQSLDCALGCPAPTIPSGGLTQLD